MSRPAARTFQDMIVWQKAHELVLRIYSFSADSPKGDVYGLTSQLRRAVVSVPANIAEGFKKIGRADKVRFMNIAQGSLEESRYPLILARDLGTGDISETTGLLEEVGKLLEAYASAIHHSGS